MRIRDKSGVRLGISHLWFFETSIGTRLEVSEIAEDTLFEFLHIADGAPKSLKAKDECSHNIRAGNMVETTPKDAGNVLLVR